MPEPKDPLRVKYWGAVATGSFTVLVVGPVLAVILKAWWPILAGFGFHMIIYFWALFLKCQKCGIVWWVHGPKDPNWGNRNLLQAWALSIPRKACAYCGQERI